MSTNILLYLLPNMEYNSPPFEYEPGLVTHY